MKRILLLLALAACDDMGRQDRVDAYDGPAAPPIHGTVARGTLAEFSPPDVTPDLMARGEARFAIYCVPCHGAQGRGDGPVAGRTMPFPPPFAKVDASLERIVEIITQGSGPMPPYGDRIPAADRWAIAAHVEKLQGLP